ncbi:8895_t:CDS:1, partial [Dentiscutata erythropus]
MASLSAPSLDLDINEPTSFSEAEASASMNPIPQITRKNDLDKSTKVNRINKSHTSYFLTKTPRIM